VIATSDVEAVHGLLLIVHRKVYTPMPPAGVKVATGFDTLLNWVIKVLGPDITDHDPVPTDGVFAAKVAVPLPQTVCGLPALAVVGGAFTVIFAVLFVPMPPVALVLESWVTVTVVAPALAKAGVVKVPVPAVVTFIVAVLPVAVFAPERL